VLTITLPFVYVYGILYTCTPKRFDDHYQAQEFVQSCIHTCKYGVPTCYEVLLCGCYGTKVRLLFLDETEVLMTLPDVNLVERTTQHSIVVQTHTYTWPLFKLLYTPIMVIII
jgi:hypothetical protein